jgi:type III secretion protein U
MVVPNPRLAAYVSIASMSEKTEKPTNRKLRDARKKGEVHKSKDVTQFAIFASLLGIFALMSNYILDQMKGLLLLFRDGLPGRDSDPQLLFRVFQIGEKSFFGILTPILATVIGVGILVGFLQVRSLFSIDPIKPKPERLNPATNLKNMFSSRTIVGLIKTLLHVLLVGGLVLSVVYSKAPEFAQSSVGTPLQVFSLLMQTLQALCIWALAAYIFTSALDYGHQYYEFMKQQRMSKDEVKREYKDVEGDPYVKAQRKSLHRSLSQGSGVKNMNKSNIVVTNPTHYAIALRYERASGDLPMVVAKGKDEEAKLIREEAALLGIPIVENKPLARRLYAQVPINRFIGQEHFADVAKTMVMAASQRPSGAGVKGV